MKNSYLKWLVGILAILNVASLSYILVTSIWVPRASGSTISPAIVNSSDEITLLRAQVEAIQRYHSDVLTTVWGAIASIATVIAVVAFAGMVQSARVYQQDKSMMQQELKSNLETETQVFQETIRRDLAQAQENLKREIDSQLGKNLGIIQSEIAAVKQENERIGKATEGHLQEQMDDLRKNYLESRIDMLDLEARSWAERGSFSIAFSINIQRLEYALELDKDTGGIYEYEIERALAAIRRLLEKNGVRPNAEDAGSVLELLERVPEQYRLEVKAVTGLIENARAANISQTTDDGRSRDR